MFNQKNRDKQIQHWEHEAVIDYRLRMAQQPGIMKRRAALFITKY
ncbi:hypothetical protein [Methylotuvimicrobium sp. KM2]